MRKQVDLPGVTRVRVKLDSEATAALSGVVLDCVGAVKGPGESDAAFKSRMVGTMPPMTQAGAEALLGYTDWCAGEPPPCTGFWDVTVYLQIVKPEDYDRLWYTAPQDSVMDPKQGTLRLPSGLVIPWGELRLQWRGLRAPWHAGYDYKVPEATYNPPQDLDDEATWKTPHEEATLTRRPRVRL